MLDHRGWIRKCRIYQANQGRLAGRAVSDYVLADYILRSAKCAPAGVQCRHPPSTRFSQLFNGIVAAFSMTRDAVVHYRSPSAISSLSIVVMMETVHRLDPDLLQPSYQCHSFRINRDARVILGSIYNINMSIISFTCFLSVINKTMLGSTVQYQQAQRKTKLSILVKVARSVL
jgi:hypothetical protein